MNKRKSIKEKFAKLLVKEGFDFVSGVPCATQKEIIAYFSREKSIKHVPATRESEAIGISTGAYLAGKKPLVYMQNSGLMNSINDITSLLIPYKIPLLFLVTWRGHVGEDAPQHMINGKSILKTLDAIEVPYLVLDQNLSTLVDSAKKWLYSEKTPLVILIVRKKYD